jgi:hypothetical protein
VSSPARVLFARAVRDHTPATDRVFTGTEQAGAMEKTACCECHIIHASATTLDTLHDASQLKNIGYTKFGFTLHARTDPTKPPFPSTLTTEDHSDTADIGAIFSAYTEAFDKPDVKICSVNVLLLPIAPQSLKSTDVEFFTKRNTFPIHKKPYYLYVIFCALRRLGWDSRDEGIPRDATDQVIWDYCLQLNQ